jgi:hypothetical protein
MRAHALRGDSLDASNHERPAEAQKRQPSVFLPSASPRFRVPPAAARTGSAARGRVSSR